MVLQLPTCRPDRLAVDLHAGLARRPAALAQIARSAGRGDILPGRAPALGARHDMVERQLAVAAAIDTAEAVAKEQVEPGEGRIFVGADELAQGDDRRQLQRLAGAVHFAVVMGDDVDAFEEHRLDRRLPGPQRQRIVTERRVVGVEHQRRAAVDVANEVRMIHDAGNGLSVSARIEHRLRPCRTQGGEGPTRARLPL